MSAAANPARTPPRPPTSAALVWHEACHECQNSLRTSLSALVAAGSPVRVRLAGAGFAIAARGKALGGGAAQQDIQVRLDNGRLIRGSVAPDGSVQLMP